MRGTIRRAAGANGPGSIEGSDGHLYRYAADDLQVGPAAIDAAVIFFPEGDEARSVEVERGEEAMLATPERNWLAFYMSPVGRVSRRDYWLLGFVPITIVNLALRLLPAVVGLPLSLILVWANIALSFRRCHDVGRSGWWSILPFLSFFLFVFAPDLAADRSSTARTVSIILLGIAACLSLLWVVFGIYARAGQQGANRFGPDPKMP